MVSPPSRVKFPFQMVLLLHKQIKPYFGHIWRLIIHHTECLYIKYLWRNEACSCSHKNDRNAWCCEADYQGRCDGHQWDGPGMKGESLRTVPKLPAGYNATLKWSVRVSTVSSFQNLLASFWFSWATLVPLLSVLLEGWSQHITTYIWYLNSFTSTLVGRKLHWTCRSCTGQWGKGRHLQRCHASRDLGVRRLGWEAQLFLWRFGSQVISKIFKSFI